MLLEFLTTEITLPNWALLAVISISYIGATAGLTLNSHVLRHLNKTLTILINEKTKGESK